MLVITSAPQLHPQQLSSGNGSAEETAILQWLLAKSLKWQTTINFTYVVDSLFTEVQYN